MAEVARALTAEALKLKRTRALMLAIVAPTFVVAIQVSSGTTYLNPDVPGLSLGEQVFDTVFNMWIIIVFILYLVLEIALLMSIDHASNQWKHLFALPVSRTTIYLAKLFAGVILILFSNILLFIETTIAIFVLGVAAPELGISLAGVDITYFFGILLAATIAAFFAIALHTWMSIRTRNFLAPVAVGFAGGFLNLIALGSSFLQKFSPWTYPLDVHRMLSVTTSSVSEYIYSGWPLPLLLAISISGGIAVTCYALYELNRKDVY